tara:strand:- start:323 stop:463 length:141 start_codon:yes stop_codon:yes gene_type:complete
MLFTLFKFEKYLKASLFKQPTVISHLSLGKLSIRFFRLVGAPPISS